MPCNGNFDGDLDVDAEDVTEFLIHFGRSQFNDPCPPDPPAPVEKSRQTTSYSPGDDGYYQKGVTWPNPRFTDNGDGTVTDNLTGLIWLKDANCFGTTFFDQAVNNSNWLADPACGLTDGSNPGDWRLPNVKEFESLLDYGEYDPAVPLGHPFINLEVDFYWTSTTWAGGSDVAFTIYMKWADVGGYSKYNFFYVWPVRGGQ